MMTPHGRTRFLAVSDESFGVRPNLMVRPLFPFKGGDFELYQTGGEMESYSHTTSGIELLVKECRFEFQRTENIDYYSKEDYHEAERKYVKLCIAGVTQSASSQTLRDR